MDQNDTPLVACSYIYAYRIWMVSGFLGYGTTWRQPWGVGGYGGLVSHHPQPQIIILMSAVNTGCIKQAKIKAATT